MSGPPHDDGRPLAEAPENVVNTDLHSIGHTADKVWLACRIPGCDVVAEVSQERLDELLRTRPGSHDLCGVHYAKYGEWEVAR